MVGASFCLRWMGLVLPKQVLLQTRSEAPRDVGKSTRWPLSTNNAKIITERSL